MKKAIIYKDIFEAKKASHQEALNGGCSGATAYWYPMQELTTTSTLTKAEYAELHNIPATIFVDEVEKANPEYTELANSIDVPKYAMVVGDDKDTVDDNGETIVPAEVVDITNLVPVIEEEL